MKNTYIILFISFTLFSCNFETPTQFSEEALGEIITTLAGDKTTLKNVLEEYKGKTVLIDVWATWCRDCIESMPKVRELQNEFNDVEFVFLSVDRNISLWKRGIEKYSLKGDHYFINSGQKGTLTDFLNSNWIPRYLIIDKNGNIKLFKAKTATDRRIKEALK